jgi:O-methyltransferase
MPIHTARCFRSSALSPICYIRPVSDRRSIDTQGIPNHTPPLKALREALRIRSRVQGLSAQTFDLALRMLVRPFHHSLFWGDRLLTLDKSAGFLTDQSFRTALAQADSSTGANQYASPDGIAWRYNTLVWAARTCLGLPGDFVECGVYRGDMTWMITQTVDMHTAGKKFYLYDTFAGLDPRYPSEFVSSKAQDFAQFSASEYQAEDIEGYVRKRFLTMDYVVVSKGVVPDVLHQIAPERIAFMHLDMNSPKAEAGALEMLFDRVSPGGIIVFDDYGWKQFEKQKESADRFMASRGQLIMELPTGQGLMIKR